MPTSDWEGNKHTSREPVSKYDYSAVCKVISSAKNEKAQRGIKRSPRRWTGASSLHSSKVLFKDPAVQQLLKKPSCDPLILGKHRPIISKDHFL